MSHSFTSLWKNYEHSLKFFKDSNYAHTHWRQTGLKSGDAEFETYLVKFETYAVIRDYETKKTAGAAEPPEPSSLAPMFIFDTMS